MQLEQQTTEAPAARSPYQLPCGAWDFQAYIDERRQLLPFYLHDRALREEEARLQEEMVAWYGAAASERDDDRLAALHRRSALLTEERRELEAKRPKTDLFD